MKLVSLSPVANRIRFGFGSEKATLNTPGYQLTFVDSGTSALALALVEVKQTYPDIERPEVIVPGYCCPDLLSAALYAGFTPVIIDVEKDDAAYSLVELEQAISSSTLAVIAVNFLGVRERTEQLSKVLSHHPKVSLIEDNAQWFPDKDDGWHALTGDYVTFSFGRGKPMSLLGGGLLLSRSSIQGATGQLATSTQQLSAVWYAKVLAYSVLTFPAFYYWIEKLPMLKLGNTEYHPLETVSMLSKNQIELIEKNHVAFKNWSNRQQEYISTELSSVNKLTSMNSNRVGRLLRYPLLCATAGQKDNLLQELIDHGLGASAMYQTSLTNVAGVSGLPVKAHSVKNAEQFATRFLTLPLHYRVSDAALEKIITIVKRHLND